MHCMDSRENIEPGQAHLVGRPHGLVIWGFLIICGIIKGCVVMWGKFWETD